MSPTQCPSDSSANNRVAVASVFDETRARSFKTAVSTHLSTSGQLSELGRVLINAQMFGLEGGNVPLGHSITGFVEGTLVLPKYFVRSAPTYSKTRALDGYTAAF